MKFLINFFPFIPTGSFFNNWLSVIIFTYIGLFGEYAVAGYGSATRIEQVVLLPVLGINTAIISIIAQNFGANYLERIKQTYFESHY